MALLGIIFFYIWQDYFIVSNKKTDASKALAGTSLTASLTGTLLVYKNHFSFHTRWIEAAYLLLFIFFISTLFLTKWQAKYFRPLVYILLLFILIVIIHDAITKTSLL